MRLLTRVVKDEKGQDLVEYGMLVVLIALVAIVAIKLLGPTINTVFSNANAQLST